MGQALCDTSRSLDRQVPPQIFARLRQIQCQETELCKIPGRAAMIGILFQGIGEMTYGVSELPFLGGNLPKQKIELAPILDGNDGWRMQQLLGEFGIADAALNLHPAAPQPEMVRKQRGGFARGLQGGMPVSRRAQQVTAPRGNRRVDTEAGFRVIQHG